MVRNSGTKVTHTYRSERQESDEEEDEEEEGHSLLPGRPASCQYL